MLKLSINWFYYSWNTLNFGHCLHIRQTSWFKNCTHISSIYSLLFHYSTITLRVIRYVVQIIKGFDEIIKSDKFKMLCCLSYNYIFFLSFLILDWVKKWTTNKSSLLEFWIYVWFDKLWSKPETRLIDIFLQIEVNWKNLINIIQIVNSIVTLCFR